MKSSSVLFSLAFFSQDGPQEVHAVVACPWGVGFRGLHGPRFVWAFTLQDIWVISSLGLFLNKAATDGHIQVAVWPYVLCSSEINTRGCCFCRFLCTLPRCFPGWWHRFPSRRDPASTRRRRLQGCLSGLGPAVLLSPGGFAFLSWLLSRAPFPVLFYHLWVFFGAMHFIPLLIF